MRAPSESLLHLALEYFAPIVPFPFDHVLFPLQTTNIHMRTMNIKNNTIVNSSRQRIAILKIYQAKFWQFTGDKMKFQTPHNTIVSSFEIFTRNYRKKKTYLCTTFSIRRSSSLDPSLFIQMHGWLQHFMISNENAIINKQNLRMKFSEYLIIFIIMTFSLFPESFLTMICLFGLRNRGARRPILKNGIIHIHVVFILIISI